MRLNTFCIFFLALLTSCLKPKTTEIKKKIDRLNYCEEEYCHKFKPDAYRPVEIDVGTCEIDFEIKNQELMKFLEYHLITYEEYQNKLHLTQRQRDKD